MANGQRNGFSWGDAWLWEVIGGFATAPAPIYRVGDLVEVTNDATVGEREVVLARGVVEAVNGHAPQYVFVQGVLVAQTARTLRLVLRGGAQ